MLTIILAIANNLPRGTKVGLLAKLDTSLDINDTDDDDDRCTHADNIPIHSTGLSGVLAVRVPDLLELWTELGQLGRIGIMFPER